MNTSLVLALLAAGGATLLDWGLGILNALKTGTFNLQKLPAQLENMVLPFLVPSGLLTVFQGWASQFLNGALGGSLPPVSEGVAFGAIGAYGAKVLQDIFLKIQTLATSTPATPAAPPVAH